MKKIINLMLFAFVVTSVIYYAGGDYYSQSAYVPMSNSQSDVSEKIVLNDIQTIDISYSQNKILNPVDKRYSFSKIFIKYMWPADVHFFQRSTYGEYCKNCVQNKALLNNELPADVSYYQAY